nr:hypothetical protein [Desulforamulus aquiferis]
MARPSEQRARPDIWPRPEHPPWWGHVSDRDCCGGFVSLENPGIPGRAEGLIVLAVTMGYGLIGFIDDFIKVVLKRNLGLKSREKLLGQLIIASILAVLAVFNLGRGTDYLIPFSGFFTPGGIGFDLGWWPFFGLTVLVLLGTTNGVNLTDGLDGLAAGATVFTAGAFMLLALGSGKVGVAVVLAAVAGGCLGFLVYNKNPAKVFMGDTGSLALGGALELQQLLPGTSCFWYLSGDCMYWKPFR